MRKVVATAVGLAAGAFAVGAALAGSRSAARREELPREPAPAQPPMPTARRDAPPARRDVPPARKDPPLREIPTARLTLSEAHDDEFYTPSASAPFGPYHGARRPIGLPTLIVEASGSAGRVLIDGIDEATARAKAIEAFGARYRMTPSQIRVRPVRRASARGAALRPIEEQAARHGHGPLFVKTIVHLARTEGEGGTFAVPARNFVAACTDRALHPRRLCTTVDAPRNKARGLITAWGVFQWNRDAGRELKALDKLGVRAPFIPSDWLPWDWNAAEEIAIPINYYAQLWALVRKHGGSEHDAARGARLWHVGPSYFRTWLQRGANPTAWSKVDRTHSP